MRVRPAWGKTDLAPKRDRGRAAQKRNFAIKLRDKWTCQNPECGVITTELEIDHIVPLSEGGSDEDSNKQSLCITCHRAKSAVERSKVGRGTSLRFG
jgi:5-methylcytosine-specific restriction protein A